MTSWQRRIAQWMLLQVLLVAGTGVGMARPDSSSTEPSETSAITRRICADFSRLTDAQARAIGASALERTLMVRLVQDGYAVVARASDADACIETSVQAVASGYVLRVKIAPTRGEPGTAIALEMKDFSDTTEHHLLAAQRVSAQLRSWPWPPRASVRANHPPRMDRYRVGVGPAVHLRGDDGMWQVQVRLWWMHPRWHAMTVASVADASTAELAVRSAYLGAGVGTSLLRTKRVRVDTSVLGLVTLHSYRPTDAWSYRTDVALHTPIDVRWTWSDDWSLVATVGVTAHRSTVRHVLDGETIWQAPSFGANAGLLVARSLR